MLLFLAAAAPLLAAEGSGVMQSRQAKADAAPSADPDSRFWKGVPAVIAENGRKGEPIPNHRTEVRSRWTDKNLYFLFVCPYEKLHLKPNPVTREETNGLWNWDVAEVFIGNDFKQINHYYEFEISPQGEWVDLDINRLRGKQMAEAGWKWNSNFEVKCRIDEGKKVWYGEMKIPFASIDQRKIEKGLEYRINLYRCQGSGADRKYIAWQPVGSMSFHAPEAFGKLILAGE